MAGDNLNAADKVEAKALQPGENTNLSSVVDFNKEQQPLAFKPENSDKKLAPDFQLDFGSTDIYSSGLGDYSNLGKSAPKLDLYPQGKMISFDVGETKVASAQNADSAETVVKTEDQTGKPAETVVKTEDQTGKAAETVVKTEDQAGKPADTAAKSVDFAPHPVKDGETYWSIAKDHLKATGGHDPSNTEVMNYMTALAKHNGLTVEQAAHIDHNDVVHFPPEKQAVAAGGEKTQVAKDGGPDGNGETAVVKEAGADDKSEAQTGKDAGPNDKVEAETGKDVAPSDKVEVQAQKTEQAPDVVVPLNLFPDEQGTANQPNVEAKPEVQPEAVPNPKPVPKVVEANTAVPPNPEEKFEPTDFTV